MSFFSLPRDRLTLTGLLARAISVRYEFRHLQFRSAQREDKETGITSLRVKDGGTWSDEVEVAKFWVRVVVTRLKICKVRARAAQCRTSDEVERIRGGILARGYILIFFAFLRVGLTISCRLSSREERIFPKGAFFL